MPLLFAIEELGDMTGECASVLKQRSVTRVRVDDELGIGQMLAECERVEGGDHRVVVSVGDKYRLRDLLQISAGLVSGLGPHGHRCKLGSGCLGTSWSVLIPSSVPAVLETLAPPLGSFP